MSCTGRFRSGEEDIVKKARKKAQSNVHVISFRVNDEERDALLKQAQRCGGNLSLLIRKKLEMPVQKAV